MADMICVVDASVTVPVNMMPLTESGDYVTIDTSVAYNAAGMALYWVFQTVAGVTSTTAVTPTTGGNYDWTHMSGGMYKIEIPASGGASISNDTEGTGYFTGSATGILPWRGPVIQFSPAHIAHGLVTGTEFLQVDAHKQRFELDGTDLHTWKPDGSTETSYSPKTVTTDPAAEPITGAS